MADELVAGSSPVWRTYLAPYGHIVAEFFFAGGTTTPYYFVGDHLSSTTVLADANGNGKEYDSGACAPAALRADRGDAWRLRRYRNGADAPTGCNSLHPSSLTLRGYIGQEMMDSFCLVNLNARMYDSGIGRVLSADPAIPDVTNGQALNRYSYVLNEPLSATDPSGMVPCIICDIKHINFDKGGGAYGGDESYDGYGPTDPCNFEDDCYVGPPGSGAQGLTGEVGVGEFGYWIIVSSKDFAPNGSLVGTSCCSLEFIVLGNYAEYGGSGSPGGSGGGEGGSDGNTPESPNKSRGQSQKNTCSTASRLSGAGLAAWHSLDAWIAAAVAAPMLIGSGAAVTVGCLNPTPFEPATCALGGFAFFVASTGAGAAVAVSGAIVKSEVAPDVKQAMCSGG